MPIFMWQPSEMGQKQWLKVEIGEGGVKESSQLPLHFDLK